MISKLSLSAFAALLAFATVSADDDYDLRLNGDFRGTQLNATTVPGWTLTPAGGSARIVQGSDFDDFAVELQGAGQNAVACSDLHPAVGNLLKIEAEIKGTGSGTIGYAAFDANRNALPGVSVRVTAGAPWSAVKNSFPLTDSRIKFVQIVLTAEKGSTVAFGDVEAEFRNLPGNLPSLPISGAVNVAGVPTPSGLQPVSAAPAPAPAAARQLIHNRRYALSDLTNVAYQATVPLRGEIDFELEENATKGEYWSITSYDSTICRVEMEHDRSGIWPFRRDQAEIELKGLKQGTTPVVFTYPDGRTFQVLFTVR